MKKILTFLVTGLVLLTACASQSSTRPPSSNVEQSETGTGGLTEKEFKKFAEAPLQPIDGKESTEAKLAPANNGVLKTSVDGTEQIDFRTYQVPNNWMVHPRTQDAERDVVYIANNDDLDYIIMLYPLNAYAESPLDGGDYLSNTEVISALQADGQNFIYQASTKIGDQTWGVGYQEAPENHISAVTFYLLENTGNFDDSLWVGNVLFPYNIKDLAEDMEPLELIGQVKTILEQISQRSNEK